MRQDKFLQRLEEEYAKNVAISRVKNQDYANENDAFANFKACSSYGVDPKMGIIVRMTDKLVRVSNLLNKEAKVKDESIGDTLSDLANYAMILKLFIESEEVRTQ